MEKRPDKVCAVVGCDITTPLPMCLAHWKATPWWQCVRLYETNRVNRLWLSMDQLDLEAKKQLNLESYYWLTATQTVQYFENDT